MQACPRTTRCPEDSLRLARSRGTRKPDWVNYSTNPRKRLAKLCSNDQCRDCVFQHRQRRRQPTLLRLQSEAIREHVCRPPQHEQKRGMSARPPTFQVRSCPAMEAVRASNCLRNSALLILIMRIHLHRLQLLRRIQHRRSRYRASRDPVEDDVPPKLKKDAAQRNHG